MRFYNMDTHLRLTFSICYGCFQWLAYLGRIPNLFLLCGGKVCSLALSFYICVIGWFSFSLPMSKFMFKYYQARIPKGNPSQIFLPIQMLTHFAAGVTTLPSGLIPLIIFFFMMVNEQRAFLYPPPTWQQLVAQPVKCAQTLTPDLYMNCFLKR